MRTRHRLALAAILALITASTAGKAEEAPVFKIEIATGKLTPQRLEVPAGKAFRLEVTNAGTATAEFESKELHKEKMIAPKATAVISVKALAPGEYGFFDELQPKAPTGTIVAK